METNINKVACNCASSLSGLTKALRGLAFKRPVQFGGNLAVDCEDIYITRILYNCPVTVVFFSDGTKTVSKCREGDIYSRELGMTVCILKKLYGNDWVRTLFSDWVVGTNNDITLHDVRKTHNSK